MNKHQYFEMPEFYENMHIFSGYYCDQEGQTAVTGPCAPGFYCETGSDNDSPIICPQGKYCPEGTYQKGSLY